jgi:hypothetical protein
VVAVDLDIARLHKLERNRPLNFFDLPTTGQLPFHLGGNPGIAREFPVGVPVRDHVEKQTGRERLSRNDGGNVSNQLRLNELSTFVGLGPGRAQGGARRKRTGTSRATIAPPKFRLAVMGTT